MKAPKLMELFYRRKLSSHVSRFWLIVGPFWRDGPLFYTNSTERHPSIKKTSKVFEVFSVPETGIEPAHPCERQILSLLRLPIPPPGLRGCNITTSRLIAVECDGDIFSCNNILLLAAVLLR